jgi:hypothetical protein
LTIKKIPTQENPMSDQTEQSVLEAQSHEDAVSVDALTEALDTLAKAMKKEPEGSEYSKAKDSKSSKQVSLFEDEDEDEDEDMEDEGSMSEEDDDEDMEKALPMYGFEEAMKAMAAGTDKIVADMEKRMGALMKGMESLLSEMKALKGEQVSMAKSLNALGAAPVPPRAAFSAITPPAPVAPVVDRAELMRKSLTMLQDPQLDAARKARIRSAVALLESGADPRTIDSLVNG